MEKQCFLKPIRFAVRSMGSVEIDDVDLTQERSSKAVNKAINDLSIGNAENKFGDVLILEIFAVNQQNCIFQKF